MGAGRYGQEEGARGHLSHPWKCRKVFCALAVTVKRSVDQFLMHYFQHFSSAPTLFAGLGKIWRVGMVHLVVLACVLTATTKKGRQLFLRKKVHPEKILATPVNLPAPGKNDAGAHKCDIRIFDSLSVNMKEEKNSEKVTLECLFLCTMQ